MKRLFALVLALIMVLSLATTAFADEADHSKHTITINETASGHVFEAYQIFAGDVTVAEGTGDKILSNVRWGSGIDASVDHTATINDKTLNLLEALKDSEVNPYYAHYAALNYPEALPADATEEQRAKYAEEMAALAGKVANALAQESTTAHGKAFAKIVGEYLTDTATRSVENTDAEGNTTKYVISGLSDGYYLVKENDQTEIGNQTATDYILNLVEDVTVTAKDGEVTQDKDIIEGGRPVEVCSNNVGDVVTFEIDGTLPENLAEYDKFYYAIVDTMSAGLTLDPDSIKVSTINGDSIKVIDPTEYNLYINGVTAGADEFKSADGTTAATFAVEFKNLKKLTTSGEYTVRSTTKIRVEYTATVNNEAVIGGQGNPNESYVKFSRSPYKIEDHSQTPPSIVRVFTFQLEVLKKDGKADKALQGVKFVIARERSGHMQYAILDASNTVTGWTNWLNEADVADYVKNHAEHGKLDADGQAAKVAELVSTVGVATELVTNESGKFNVKGLDLDLYWLIETQALSGYNAIDPIKFTIAGEYDSTTENLSTLEIIIDNIHANGDITNGMVSTTVINNPGNTLPSTGGMGTTLFYVVGGIMVAAAFVLLVTKKRMAAEN